VNLSSALTCKVEIGGVHSALVGKTEGKKPLARPRRRREDNIKLDLQEVGCGVYGLESIWLRIGTGGGYF
jgi:hypothetical protein